jgi:hypothetical protein
VTTVAVDDRPPGAPPASGDPGKPRPDRRAAERTTLAVRCAWALFGIQLVALLLWSALLYSRWGMTWDFGIRYQGWWGIAHGNLDPYSTLTHYYFWQDHFELINWPLAPISLLWPGGLWPLVVQDLMIVGGELGALYLVVDAVRRPGWTSRLPGWIAVGLVTVLLMANPWIYQSQSFDSHYQSVGAACFAMLACREMIRGRMRLLILWVVLCLACGDIAGTYLVAVGVGGMLAGRSSRRRGAALVGIGIAWFLGVTTLGGGRGSGLAGHYGYLVPRSSPATGAKVGAGALAAGALAHPTAVLAHLWQSRLDMWAYASSSGGIGIFSPLAVLPALILFESGAGNGGGLRSIAYENFGAVLFLPPLSVLTLAWIARQLHHGPVASRLRRRSVRWLRSPRVPIVIAGILACNTLGWAIVWLPQVPAQWLLTSSSSATALNQAARMIPPDAEVVASQGVVGRFCGRPYCYGIFGPSTFPLRTADTYFVITPYSGIELNSVHSALSMIGTLAGPLHATLLLGKDGVWLFRLHADPGQHAVSLATLPTVPAWAAQSATGRPTLSGPPQQWAMTLTGTRPGYLVYGASWNLPPGRYEETVTLATAITTDVEVWDASTNTLLSRRLVPASDGNIAVQAPVTITTSGAFVPYGGWGPFRFLPKPPATSDDRIELRLWTPGSGAVRVYSLEIQPLPAVAP